MPIPSLQLQKKKPVSCREAEKLFTELWSPGLVEKYSHLRWFHVTTAKQLKHLEIELLTTVGWKWGCQPFSCPCSQNVICFICLFRLRNLNLHSLPVAWCSWEQVFYGLPPPVDHGDSFAAKELLSPLLSPRIIFTHRIQSTAGRIWPSNWKIWPVCSGSRVIQLWSVDK